MVIIGRQPPLAAMSPGKRSPASQSPARRRNAAPHQLILRSKSVQLTEYLRDLIQKRRLPEPLPGGRLWSQQLGVSRRILDESLKELQHQGLITIGRRGVRLNASRKHKTVARRRARGWCARCYSPDTEGKGTSKRSIAVVSVEVFLDGGSVALVRLRVRITLRLFSGITG